MNRLQGTKKHFWWQEELAHCHKAHQERLKWLWLKLPPLSTDSCDQTLVTVKLKEGNWIISPYISMDWKSHSYKVLPSYLQSAHCSKTSLIWQQGWNQDVNAGLPLLQRQNQVGYLPRNMHQGVCVRVRVPASCIPDDICFLSFYHLFFIK